MSVLLKSGILVEFFAGVLPWNLRLGGGRRRWTRSPGRVKIPPHALNGGRINRPAYRCVWVFLGVNLQAHSSAGWCYSIGRVLVNSLERRVYFSPALINQVEFGSPRDDRGHLLATAKEPHAHESILESNLKKHSKLRSNPHHQHGAVVLRILQRARRRFRRCSVAARPLGRLARRRHFLFMTQKIAEGRRHKPHMKFSGVK